MNTTIKVVLFLFIAVVCYVAYQYVRTRHYIRIGVALADSVVAYEQHTDDSLVRILTIGDSSVVGTGSDNPTLSVAGRIGSDFPTAEIVNLGVNGTRTPELVERFEGLSGQHFDLIVIHTGGNDIVRFTALDEFESTLNTVLSLARNMSDRVVHLHGGNVGTAPLFPAGTRWLFTRRTKQVREISLRATEAHDVHYVDIFRSSEDDPFGVDPDRFYADDYFHPSAEGYGDWYSFIKPVIDKTGFGVE